MIFTAEYRCLEFEPLLFFRPALGGGESRSRGVAVGMDAVGDADFRFGMLYSGDFARYSNAPGVFDCFLQSTQKRLVLSSHKLLVFDKTRASVLAERPRNVKRSLVADVAFILHFLGRRMLHIFRKLIKRNSCTIFAVFCFGPAL